MGAANLTPWMAFVHHAKMDMKDEFQSNWLDKKGENSILADAFSQARGIDLETLLNFDKKFEGKRLDWIWSFSNYPKIIEFIIKNQKALNINFALNGKEWDGNETFGKACEDGDTVFAELLMNHSSILNIDLDPYNLSPVQMFHLDNLVKKVNQSYANRLSCPRLSTYYDNSHLSNKRGAHAYRF